MSSEPNYPLGFLYTCAAGATTCLGLAFIPLVNSGLMSQQRSIAAALAFASGVMLWLAFMGVLGGEAKEFFVRHYNDHGHDHGPCYETEEPIDIRIWIGVFFLIGMAVTAFMEQAVDRCFGEGHGHGHGGHDPSDAHEGHAHGTELVGKGDSAAGEGEIGDAENNNLMKVSVVAMLGLTLHNLPEGLAVFFSASDANLTILLGIALHNIPGGAAIAVPIYKSTSSYCKALAATAFAGVAQPLGAGIGWALIVGMGLDTPTDFAYGAAYAATAGTLVAVALAGMLPEALNLSTNFFVLCWLAVGFIVMESSIILMEATGGHSHD